MNNIKAALTPNTEVINHIVNSMDVATNGQFKKDIIKMGLNELDFALFVVKFTVDMGFMSVEQIWNKVFGEGSYDALKNEVYNLLEAS